MKCSFKHIVCLLFFFLFVNLLQGQQQFVNPDSWVATDDLKRTLPEHTETGEKRAEKFVGMFFWNWHVYDHFLKHEPINVNEIVTKYPEAVNDFDHPIWTRKGRHHWSESIFGYYHSTDRWVLRKQAEMFADASIDAVFFDCTNPPWIWDKALDALAKEWTKAIEDGVNVPKIVFMCPFTPHEKSKKMIHTIYYDIYKKGLYKNLWFYWNGKPLIMAYPDNVDDEVKNFFTFRPGQPTYQRGSQRDTDWAWLEEYPQHGYVEYETGKFEQLAVGVAQNATDQLRPAAMNDTNQVYGRSYTQKSGMNHAPGAVNYGYNFQEQWERAFELDPQLVFVTGWNEWTAGRHREWQGTENAFPDQYNQEYSRDIEPMKGGHSDNYYMQLVSNVRKFKGLTKQHELANSKTITIDGSFDDWDDVTPIYYDYKDNYQARNHRGYGSTWYRNKTLRNDIVSSKVSHDRDNIYFYVQTNHPISTPDKNWMMLLINIDREKGTGWEGYDFIINRKKPNQKKLIMEHSNSKWEWNEISEIDYILTGQEMELCIPKAILKKQGEFEFKWVDYMQNVGDIMDFYIYGDVAPSGRFNYLYILN